MSQAPTQVHADATSEASVAFLEASARRADLIRQGLSNSGHERNCCYLNLHDGTFANVSSAIGLDAIGDGRAYALSDWDHDGDLDLWATQRTSPRWRYWENRGHRQGHYLALRLVGTRPGCNRDAIGARVTVSPVSDDDQAPPPGPQLRTLRAGEGFLSQSSKWLHFGFDQATAVHVSVRWPDGSRDDYDNVAADAHYEVQQGSPRLRRFPPRPTAVRDDAPGTPRVNRRAPPAAASQPPLNLQPTPQRVALTFRLPLPSLPYQTQDGNTAATVVTPVAHCRLVHLWASWCAPCREELETWSDAAERFAAMELDVLALNVDHLADTSGDVRPAFDASHATATQILESLSFPFDAGMATEEWVDKFEALRAFLFDDLRPWSVPTSLLIDREGRLAVIYTGPVDLNQLEHDVRLCQVDAAEWRAAALPFPGTWLTSGAAPHLSLLVHRLLPDYPQDAFAYDEHVRDLLPQDALRAETLRHKALFLLDRNLPTSAERTLKEAIAMAPDVPQGYADLARVYRRTQRPSAAVATLNEAIRRAPNQWQFRTQRASALMADGRWSAAIRELRQVVDQSPTPRHMSNLAGMLATNPRATLEQREEAVRWAEQAAQQSDSPRVWETLGIALQRLQRDDEAADAWRRALDWATQPEDAKLRDRLEARLRKLHVLPPS